MQRPTANHEPDDEPSDDEDNFDHQIEIIVDIYDIHPFE